MWHRNIENLLYFILKNKIQYETANQRIFIYFEGVYKRLEKIYIGASHIDGGDDILKIDTVYITLPNYMKKTRQEKLSNILNNI